MESEDDDFTEMVAEVVLEFGGAVMRREAAQRAIERVVERVDRFNGDKAPFYLESYNAEMEAQEVDEALRLEFFYRAVAVRMHVEVKELRKAHSSWEAFEEALWQAYGEPLRSQNQCDLDQWVMSTKTN